MRFAVTLAFILLSTGLLAQETPDVPLPRERPAETTEAEQPGAPETPLPTPAPLEPRVYQSACPALLTGRIDAKVLEPINEDACGERSPLAVSAVLANGRMVPLSGTPTLTCAMAGALPDWVEAVDSFVTARENTRIARVVTGTSYACRNRNNASTGDLSEHAFANALDVVGFELEDERTMALPGGWTLPHSPAGRLLRFAHGAACARFSTTLGPEANAQHADHLHLDLGCHGQSCTARLCE